MCGQGQEEEEKKDSKPKTNNKRYSHTIKINIKRLIEPIYLNRAAVRGEHSRYIQG